MALQLTGPIQSRLQKGFSRYIKNELVNPV